MTTITSRSKTAVRYTTAPADMGYGGTPTNWRQAPADVITSPAKALDYVADLKRKLGGADYAVEFRCGAQVVSTEDLTEAVIASEAKRAGY